MRSLLLLALLACSHSKPAPAPGPKPTADPSLGGQAQSSGAATQPTAFHSTVDPPLGGWSNATSSPATSSAPGATTTAPPPKPATPKPATTTTTTTSTTTTSSTAPATKPGSTVAATPPGAISPTPPATGPTAPAVPVAPVPVTMRAKQPSTPNSCAKQNRDCTITFAPAVAGNGGMHGSVKGILSSDSNVPACPVDLVDGGTRRVASGTAHNGAYEISASAGHYSVSFERCLGCDPGLIDVDLVDAGTATVSLACKTAGR